jgi:anthranilate phosphoribosyltransferase
VSPDDFGFQRAGLAEIKGGTPEENAAMLQRILDGEKGPLRDVVVMNAAAALLAGDKVGELKAGARLAEEVIDSGRAREKLDGLVKLSQSLG